MQYTEPRLLALDMDGTLLDTHGHISEVNRAAMRAAQARGVQVVLATGRDYDGIPWQELDGVSLDYAITTNGSSVYRIADRACLYEQCLPSEEAAEIFEWLLQKQVYIDIFVDGRDYAPREVLPLVDRLTLPDYIMDSLRHKRTVVDELVPRLRSGELKVQKGTLNFWPEADGTLHAYAETLRFLNGLPYLTTVDGGFNNVEFTRKGTSKAAGLAWLAGQLHIPMERTIAIGDSENDAEMLKAAGLGIAMANAPASLHALAKASTASNDEDGVAQAIERFLL